MKRLLICAMTLLAGLANAEPFYLEVEEDAEGTQTVPPVTTLVRIEVTDKADATNKLPQVVADYFAGLEYKAVFHEHYHGPNIKKPCIATPLKSSGLSKYVEVYTEVDQYHLPEIVRVACTDAADAEEKAKEIKKKDYFKDKQTKTKVKVKL